MTLLPTLHHQDKIIHCFRCYFWILHGHSRIVLEQYFSSFCLLYIILLYIIQKKILGNKCYNSPVIITHFSQDLFYIFFDKKSKTAP